MESHNNGCDGMLIIGFEDFKNECILLLNQRLEEEEVKLEDKKVKKGKKVKIKSVWNKFWIRD